MKVTKLSKQGRELHVYEDGTIYMGAYVDAVGKKRKEKILTPRKRPDSGHMWIRYKVSGDEYYHCVGRLVYEAHGDEPDLLPYYTLKFTDGDPSNLHINNLELDR